MTATAVLPAAADTVKHTFAKYGGLVLNASELSSKLHSAVADSRFPLKYVKECP